MKLKNAMFVLSGLMLLASCGGSSSTPADTSKAEGGASEPTVTSQVENTTEEKSQDTEPADLSNPASEEPSSKGGESSKAGSDSASVEESSASVEESQPASVPATSSGTHEGPYFDADHPVKIEFMSNSSYGDNIDSYIAAFNKIEPNIEVVNTKESASYQGVIDKVIEGIPANNYPDIVVGYPDAIEQIMEVGKVVKLDPYITNADYGWDDNDLEDIIETYLDEGRSYPRSGTWSLPFSKSTEAMFYNKDVLVGLDLSDVAPNLNRNGIVTVDYIENLTWEELFDNLAPAIVAHNDLLPDDKKILKDSDKYTKAVFGYDSDDNLFITLAEQYGYGYTSINEYGQGTLDFVNDGMKGLMKKFNKAKNDGYIITKGTSNGGNYTNYSFTAEAALFTIGSTGGMKYQVCDAFETAVAPIPQAAGQDRKVINQGPSLAILNHSDSSRALASWLFTKFITNEANSLNWSINTGYLPIRYSVSESLEYQQVINEGLNEDVHSLEHLQAVASQYIGNSEYVGNALFASPVFKGSAEARTQVGSLVTKLLGLSVEQCTDEAINEAFETARTNTLKQMN